MLCGCLDSAYICSNMEGQTHTHTQTDFTVTCMHIYLFGYTCIKTDLPSNSVQEPDKVY